MGCSMLTVVNLGGEPTGKNPTEDEKNAEKARVLEVRLGNNPYPTVVRPGESCRYEFDLPEGVQVYVRCRRGSTRYRATFFPK